MSDDKSIAPAGLILGLIARSQIRQSGEDGAGLATAAIVISVVFMAIWVIAFASFFSEQHTFFQQFNNGPSFP